jgi:hypothetical protein
MWARKADESVPAIYVIGPLHLTKYPKLGSTRFELLKFEENTFKVFRNGQSAAGFS